MRQVMLTTVDNPFNPFDDFESWLNFDRVKGYFTSERLARVSVHTNELSEVDEFRMVEEAMDSLIEIDEFDNLKKLVRTSK